MDHFLLLMSCVCHALASVHCCLVVTFLARAYLLTFVCDVNCVLSLFHVVIWVRCGA